MRRERLHTPRPGTAAAHPAAGRLTEMGGLLRLQRTAGNRAVGGLVGRRAVQVQRVAAQIGLDAGHATIERLDVAGRPPQTFRGSMGDHTTANIVQVAAVRGAVIGKTPAEAGAAVLELVTATEALPGHARVPHLPPEHGARLAAARREVTDRAAEMENVTEGRRVGVLQSLITAFIEYRELVPLTTLNIGEISKALAGKGKGEAGHHAVLSGRTPETSPEILQEAITGLLDLDGVARYVAEADTEIAAAVAPGADLEDRESPILAQHLASIDTAYPKAVAAAWGSRDAATRSLRASLRPLVAARRRENADFYAARLANLRRRADEEEKDLILSPPGARRKRAANVEGYRDEIRRLEALLAANGRPAAEAVDPRKRRRVAGSGTERASVRAAAQLVIDAGGVITAVLLEGRPPHALGGASMGAHTTAWVVHQDVIRRALLGRTVEDAGRALPALGTGVDELAARLGRFRAGEAPPPMRPVMERRAAEVAGAPPVARAPIVQTAVMELLARVNRLPGVAFHSVNTNGAREGAHRTVLLAREAGAETPPAALRTALLGLLDIHTVSGRADRLALLDNHLDLVRAAYPVSYAASGIGHVDRGPILRDLGERE